MAHSAISAPLSFSASFLIRFQLWRQKDGLPKGGFVPARTIAIVTIIVWGAGGTQVAAAQQQDTLLCQLGPGAGAQLLSQEGKTDMLHSRLEDQQALVSLNLFPISEQPIESRSEKKPSWGRVKC
eukprot:1771991-Amphidinium_carterae.1